MFAQQRQLLSSLRLRRVRVEDHAIEQSGQDLERAAAQFGIGGSGQLPYTIYGAVRDKQSGSSIEMMSVVWGRMVKLDPGAFKRGDIQEQTHEIKEIMRYQVTWNKAELFYYDFFASTWRVNGVDQNNDVNGILRITG